MSALMSLSETGSGTDNSLCKELLCSRRSCVLARIFLSWSVASLTSCVSLAWICINWCMSPYTASSLCIAKWFTLTVTITVSDLIQGLMQGKFQTQKQELVPESDLLWTGWGTYASRVCPSSCCLGFYICIPIQIHSNSQYIGFLYGGDLIRF